MSLTEQFYTDLRKYAQDKPEETINEGKEHNLVGILPLKISLINISVFCTNSMIRMKEEDF